MTRITPMNRTKWSVAAAAVAALALMLAGAFCLGTRMPKAAQEATPPAPAADAAAQAEMKAGVERALQGVTQDEVNWALELEKKVKAGHTPSAAETQRYQQIAARLQNDTGSGARAAPPDSDAPKTPPPIRNPVTAQELNWAVQLQAKLQQGYKPTPEEAAKYTDIFNRYAQQSPP